MRLLKGRPSEITFSRWASITEMLKEHKVCFIQTDLISPTSAKRIADLNGLDLEVQRMIGSQHQNLQGYYAFRVDSQKRFRRLLSIRQKWWEYSQLVVFTILCTLFFLLVGIWKGLVK